MFKEQNVLIVKLEAHLKHIKAITDGNILREFDVSERIIAIYDEVKLMLALIEGAKEF